MIAFTAPPAHVDRLIVHQFDPTQASPGGIDTCLRGMQRYLPRGVCLAVVGVDVGTGQAGRRLGQWEEHTSEEGRRFWFLPVVALDPANQRRRIPHSLRLMIGVVRNYRKLPDADVVQVHRMDSAVVLRGILRKPQTYFIHTQENGLTGRTSDSVWRFIGPVHRWLERWVVKRAKTVVVFNEQYSSTVAQWNTRTVFSPTWFDPSLIDGESATRDQFKILWVGRLETPKDPGLAIDTFEQLMLHDAGTPWSLDIVGPGTLLEPLTEKVAGLPASVRHRIRLLGRLTPAQVAASMARSGIFLMTSHPGYEGYPRVLVESMASGLPAVVTLGADTGGLVVSGRTGYVCGREPTALATDVRRALLIDRGQVRQSVAALDAPTLVSRLFALEPLFAQEKSAL